MLSIFTCAHPMTKHQKVHCTKIGEMSKLFEVSYHQCLPTIVARYWYLALLSCISLVSFYSKRPRSYEPNSSVEIVASNWYSIIILLFFVETWITVCESIGPFWSDYKWFEVIPAGGFDNIFSSEWKVINQNSTVEKFT